MIVSRHAAERYALRVRAASLEAAAAQLSGLAGIAEEEEVLDEWERWLRVGDLRLVVVGDTIVTCYIVGVRDAITD